MALPGSTASSLIERVQARDPAGWQRLVQLYGPLIYGWLRHAGLQGEDAADLVQEVFVSVLTGIAGFRRDREGDRFRGWLWGITRHKLLDYWRRRGTQPGAVGGSEANQRLQQVPSEEPKSASGRGGVYERALEAVRSEFEELSWQAFWRVAVDGQKAADVAADLGLTVNAVYLAKSRILARLRQELE